MLIRVYRLLFHGLGLSTHLRARVKRCLGINTYLQGVSAMVCMARWLAFYTHSPVLWHGVKVISHLTLFYITAL